MTLETFAPTPRTVTLNDGSEVNILPLRLGQMPAFNKASMAAAPYMFAADYVEILQSHPEDAAEMIRVGACMAADRVAGLYQDETVRLLVAIYEVNASFFIQRLRPEITAAAGEATARIAEVKTLLGAAFSRPSANSDTGSQQHST